MNNNDLPKIDPVIIENMEYPLPKQPNRFFQMLSNAGDKIGDVGSALRNRVSDIILGKEVEEPKTIITNEGIQSGINNGGRVGGVASFLNDVTKGSRENMSNSFQPTNLLPDKNKGFGYRLGEALGTGARLLDNSLVRGALAYGLSKYNGDYNPLEQGLIALGTNMQNKTNDRLYRNSLIDAEQNSLKSNANFQKLPFEQQQTILNNVANKYNNIRGFVDNNAYGNLMRAQQLRDNAEWRKLQHQTQEKQNEILNDIRKKEINLGYAKIQADKDKKGEPTFNNISSMRKEFSSIPAIKNANEIKRQFNNVRSTFDLYKNGKLNANATDQALITTLNKILDPTSVVRESEFDRTARGQSLKDKLQGYAQKLGRGGSGLTDAERVDLFNSMFAMYEANQAEANEYIKAYTEMANRFGINPADIMPRQYTENTQIDNTTNANIDLSEIEAELNKRGVK